MGISILAQVIEYDNSARAWGQYENDGNIATLVKYHDSERDATLAALPPELRAWVERHQGEPGRVLRAAVLIADQRITTGQAYGIYTTNYTRQREGMTYAGTHSTNALECQYCTCEDFQYKRQTCKHLYAAEKLFNDWRAQHLPDRRSLWDLTQEAVRENRHNMDLHHLTIWENGTRRAQLVQINSRPNASRELAGDWLDLQVSGCTHSLRVATRYQNQLCYGPDDAYRWEWTVRQDDYNAWSRELQATKGEQTKCSTVI